MLVNPFCEYIFLYIQSSLTSYYLGKDQPPPGYNLFSGGCRAVDIVSRVLGARALRLLPFFR